MCLIVFDWRPGDAVILRLAGNRDESHTRPTAPLAHWNDIPTILGGRDLKAGGTWLAAHTGGRLAAITNVRDPGFNIDAMGPSRGHLVHQALTCVDLPAWLARLETHAARDYAGFNLLASDGQTLWHLYHGRHGSRLRVVPPGRHGVSNASLDTPWPKLVRARQHLATLLDNADQSFWNDAWSLLSDTQHAEDDQLPDTGIGLVLERRLSAPFIVGEEYGTRASTLVEWRANGEIAIGERRFASGGIPTGASHRTLRAPPLLSPGNPGKHG